jgi:hypothetical protein
MKCSEVQHKLAENPAQRYAEEIRGHLEICSECREFYSSLEELDSLSRELRAQYRAPDDFQERVFEDYRTRISGGWFSFRSVLASIFLVALLAGAVAAWDHLENDGQLTAGILDNSVQADSIPYSPPVTEMPDENSYVEVVIESGDEEDLILRLPPVIEIHRNEIPDEETHYHTVSY